MIVQVTWRSAMVIEGKAYCFPDKFALTFRESYSRPAVYRWRVMNVVHGEKEPIYIGEAENLVRRIQRVRTPSLKAKASNTNLRLHKLFQEYVSLGRTIVLDVADCEPFEINGIRFGGDTMGDRFKRRAIENILLAGAQESPQFELLNVFVDPVEKARAMLSRIAPHQVREVLKHYGFAPK
jgi:hypothetical protein